MQNRPWFACSVLSLCVLCASSSLPSEPYTGSLAPTASPKLVVVIVIDQGRYDYLERFRPGFVEGGFNLLTQGAVFVDCRYDYATEVTAPGHSSLFTGAYPNLHGIIENTWYDRAEHRPAYCVADSDTQEVDAPNGRGGPGASPRKLMGSTLGDEMRMGSNFAAKVVAISIKDRAAVLSGGHTANGAYWWDERDGHFVTSTYYMQSLPPWVVQFNAREPARAYCGKDWRALPETPGASGKVLDSFQGSPGEPCPDPQFLKWLHRTPSMNQLELNFAEAAIKNEHLGQGPQTDLLAISLSVNDTIGHAFGPYSPEVADTTLRTDRDLAAFFTGLKEWVGLDNVWIVLSADHGVSPNSGYIGEHHLGMGNGAFPATIRAAVEQRLTEAFGAGKWVEAVTGVNVYLDQRQVKARNLDGAKVEEAAAQATAQVPGIQAAFTRTQLLSGALPRTALARKASNSFNSRRSGDVFFIREAFVVPNEGEEHSTHGSPWSYDAQVPLVFWGSRFKPGIYATPCQPIDLAATLAAALGLTQPSDSQGHPLSVALK